jgi:hypothetical protein
MKMNPSDQRKGTIWLMPAAATQERLDRFIRDYAAKTGRTPFRAHLTVVSNADPLAMTDDALRALARRAPIVLERDGVLRTKVFSRSFALQFRLSPALLALRGDARKVLGLAEYARFVPHVSLTYGFENDWAELEAFADAALAQPMQFDALEAALHTVPFADQEDVAALESLFRQELA